MRDPDYENILREYGYGIIVPKTFDSRGLTSVEWEEFDKKSRIPRNI